MQYSQEVENMCPVAKGAYHGPAPIPEEAIAGAMGHYGQWENAAKYIDPRTDEETHSVASVFPVHE